MDVTVRLEDMVSALSSLEIMIPEWARDACQDASNEIAQLNRDRLMEGRAPDGGSITPFYSPYTLAYKRKRGGITDRVTLYDYGNFHASLRIVFGSEEFHVESTDGDEAKVDYLLRHYLGEVLGFSQDDLDYIRAFIVAEPVSKRLYDFIKR